MAKKEAYSSQSLISVNQIKRGVVILKNGSLRSVLEVQGINLDLKSEDEQNSILASWRGLLNHLDFSLEIVVHSRRINIASYLDFLQERIDKEKNDLLKLQGSDYHGFLRGLITENNIMKKKFYVVIPYDPIVIAPKTILSQTVSSFKSILNLTHQSFSKAVFIPAEQFNRYQQQLMIRQNNLVSSLARIGLLSRPLITKELIELFYNLYNPETFEKESLNLPQEFN